jgi:hypothetical protein
MSHRALLSMGITAASLALTACVTPTPSYDGIRSASPNAECRPQSPSSTRVTAAELRAAHVPDLLEAVKRVRPRFVRSHAPRRDQPSVVYVDGTRVGPVYHLRDIPVMDVLEVVFVGASDATTRYGTDHTGGALLVRTQVRAGEGRCSGK